MKSGQKEFLKILLAYQGIIHKIKKPLTNKKTLINSLKIQTNKYTYETNDY